MLLSKEEEVKYIQIKTAKINSLKAEFNFEYLEERIKSVTKSIGDCELIFSRLNLPKDNEITKDEFIYGVNIMSEIKDAISTVKSFADESVLDRAIFNISNEKSAIDTYNEHVNNLHNLEDQLEKTEIKINEFSNLLSYTSDLEKRPSNCNIDDCPFIKKALESFNKKPKENLEKALMEKPYLEDECKKEKDIINKLEQIVKVEQMITNIIRNIKSSSSILNKFPTGKYLTDTETFLENFTNVIMLNELTNLQDSLCYANAFEQYKNLKSELMRLESDHKIYQNKIEIIEELNDEIVDLNSKLSKIVFDIEEKRKTIRDKEDSKLEYENKIKSLDNSIRILKEKEELEIREESLLSKLSTVTSNMDIIKQEIDKQNIINSNIANINKDIEPVSAEKDKILYSLKQLEEYNEELSIYNNKYATTELIKKYSSPTKGGIQTLFMQLYMGKTISMANELLSLLFDGKFELLPYIINESEFRIPCVNKESSVYHDDISSCSSAERAMISMMISFSLLHHSSTVYNILRLDEIDGALDQNNRSKFLIVLDKFMKELGVENCIMISHSSEMDMSNADIIQLTPVDNNRPNGNIIFTYNN